MVTNTFRWPACRCYHMRRLPGSKPSASCSIKFKSNTHNSESNSTLRHPNNYHPTLSVADAPTNPSVKFFLDQLSSEKARTPRWPPRWYHKSSWFCVVTRLVVARICATPGAYTDCFSLTPF